MRVAALLLAFCGLAPAAVTEYQARRQALGKAIPDGVIVLFGRTDQEADESRSGFFQEPNFYYLTGWKYPGAMLLIDRHREILFVPEHSREREKWSGPQPGVSDAAIQESSGFALVVPPERFETELRVSLETESKVYTVGESARSRLQAFAPLREVAGAEGALAQLRMRKSPQEVVLLRHAADATVAAHLAAWKMVASGKLEYQVAAALVSVYLDLGCERSAYAPIVAAGPDSLYLHYNRGQRRMDAGELLLVDAGAECAGYAADVTRTIPVSGKFTRRQRELYDVVLGAQKAAIAAVRPGMTINSRVPGSIYRVAYDYIDSHGKDLHGASLGKYFTHGVSHHVGLEVHDASDSTIPLEEGMVITVEPGIYIPEENIGIRIEDMLLVTKDGARLLTSALPREAGEIERALGR